MSYNLRAQVALGNWGNSLEVLFSRDRNGELFIAERLAFKEEPLPADMYCPPTLTLSRKASQELFDGLWACGFRPAKPEFDAGTLAATRGHLQDMRRLVFRNNNPPPLEP